MTEVGSAHVVVRALTHNVRKDIEKGFKDVLRDKSLFRSFGEEAGEQFETSFGDRLEKSFRTVLSNNADSNSTGGRVGTAFGDSFARAAERAILTNHAVIGERQRIESGTDGDQAGREFGNQFAKSANSALRGLETGNPLVTPKVDTSQATQQLNALSRRSGGSTSLSVGLNSSQFMAERSKLLGSLATSGKLTLFQSITSAATGAAGGVAAVTQSISQMVGVASVAPAGLLGLISTFAAVKVATAGMGDALKLAFSGAPEDVEKLDAALKNLAPTARLFTKEVASAKNDLTNIRKITQQSFFDGMAMSFATLTDQILNPLGDGLEKTASGANAIAREVMRTVGAASTVADMTTVFNNNAEAMHRNTTGAGILVSSIMRIGAAGSEYLPRLADSLNGVATRWEIFTRRVTTDGSFDAYVEKAIERSRQWGSILADTGRVIGGVFQGATNYTDGFMNRFERGMGRFAEWMNSFEGQNKIANFFDEAAEAGRDWIPILANVRGILGEVLPVLDEWSGAMLPLLRVGTGLIEDFGTQIAWAGAAFASWKIALGIINATTGGLGALKAVTDRTATSMSATSQNVGLFSGGIRGLVQDMRVQSALYASQTQQLDRYGFAVRGSGEQLSRTSALSAVLASRMDDLGQRVPVIGRMGAAFTSVYAPISRSTDAFRDHTREFGGLTSMMGRTASAATTTAGIFGGTLAAGMSAARSAVSGLVNVLGGPLNVAIMVAVAAFANYQQGAQRGKQASEEFGNSIIELNENISGFQSSLTLATTAEQVTTSFNEITSGVSNTVESFRRYADAGPSMMQKLTTSLGVVSAETAGATREQQLMAESGSALDSVMRSMGITSGEVASIIANGGPAYRTLVDNLKSSGEGGEYAASQISNWAWEVQHAESRAQNATGLEKYATAMEVLGDKTSTTTEKLEAFKVAMDIATGKNLDAEVAAARNADKIEDLAESVEHAATANGALGQSLLDGNGIINQSTEAGRNLVYTINDQRDALYAEVEAMKQSGVGHNEAVLRVQTLRDNFINATAALTGNREEAQRLWDSYITAPTEVVTSVYTPGLTTALQYFRELGLAVEITPDGKHIAVTDESPEAMARFRELRIDVSRDAHGRVIINTDSVKAAKEEAAGLGGQTYTSYHKIIQQYLPAAGEPQAIPKQPNIVTPLDMLQGGRADGAINKWTFANGGTRLPVEAKIQPSVGNMGLIQWAEASTHGEAFIPLNPAKKRRSTDIWIETGRKLGLLKSNADGSITGGKSLPSDGADDGVNRIITSLENGFNRVVASLDALVNKTPASDSARPLGASSAPAPAAPGIMNVESPLAAVEGDIKNSGNAIVGTVSGTINPALQGLTSQLQTTKMAGFDPAFQSLSAGVSQLGVNVPTVMATQVNPAITGLGANTVAVTQGVLNPTLIGLQNQVATTGNVFGAVTQDSMVPMWNGMAGSVMDGFQGTINPAFQGVMGGISAVGDSFSMGASNIATQWSRVREATAAPVRFAISSVFNDGLIGMWNSVSEMLGTTKMNPYPVRFATGTSNIGSVLPGYTPGRDPYTFVEPSTGMSIGLSGGEAIMRPEVTKVLGSDRVDNLNAAARMGGVNAVKRSLGNFAGGGVVESITGLVNKYFPGMSITSTYRNSADHHGQGLAVDFSNGYDTTPQMQAAARFFHKHYAPGLLELIHWPLNGWQNIDNGRPFDFGPGTNAQHRNHVHVAAARPLPEPGGLVLPVPSGGGAGSAPVDWGAMVSQMLQPDIDKLRGRIGGTQFPGAIGQVPGRLLDAMLPKVQSALAKAAEEMTKFSGTINNDLGAVERWRPMVIAALTRNGFAADKRNQDLMLAQIRSESGGNPSIMQQIQDVNSGGNEAQGLLQVIPGTFAAHRDPALANDRTDPWANMNAALRYYKSRYGMDLGAMWGKGHGYDKGGMLPPTPGGFGTYFNHTGGPEYVLTDPQWNGIYATAVAAARLLDPMRELARSMRDLPKYMEVVARAAQNELSAGVNAGLNAAGSAVWSALPAPVKDTVGQIQEAGRIWSSVSGYIGSKAEAWARGEWPIGSGRVAPESAGPSWMAATLETPLDQVVSTNLNIAQRIANGQEDPGRDPAANAIYDIFGRAPIIPDLQRIIAGGPDQWAYASAAMLATFETGFTEPMEAFTHETSQLTEAVLRVREAAIGLGDQVKATNDFIASVNRLPGAAATAMERIFGPAGPFQVGLFSFNPAPSAAYEMALQRIADQEAEKTRLQTEIEAQKAEKDAELAKVESDAEAATTSADTIAGLAAAAGDTAKTSDSVAETAASTAATAASAASTVSSAKSAGLSSRYLSASALSTDDDKPKGPSTWDTVAGLLHSQRWTEAFNLTADTLQKDPREIDAEGYDAWEQKYTAAVGEWKRDAFKEIGGGFLEPLGLESMFNTRVDNEYERLTAIATEAAVQAAMRIIQERGAVQGESSNKIADNLTVIGTDPADLAEKIRREQEIQFQNQSSRYRG